MTTAATIPAARDNLLGICHATARTFGFDPLILRVLLMLGLLLDFGAALAAYALLGLAVAVATLVAPAPRTPVPA